MECRSGGLTFTVMFDATIRLGWFAGRLMMAAHGVSPEHVGEGRSASSGGLPVSGGAPPPSSSWLGRAKNLSSVGLLYTGKGSRTSATKGPFDESAIRSLFAVRPTLLPKPNGCHEGQEAGSCRSELSAGALCCPAPGSSTTGCWRQCFLGRGVAGTRDVTLRGRRVGQRPLFGQCRLFGVWVGRIVVR